MRKLLLISVVMILFINVPLVKGQDFEPFELDFMIYGDGLVKVDYFLETDPTLLRVEVPLFGSHIDGILILDQDGLPLDSDINGTNLVIDTIGSTTVILSYRTPSLTTKNGVVWSFNVSAPIETRIILPFGSTIFDLSNIPNDIGSIEEREYVTLDAGNLSVSYVIGLTSIRDLAYDDIGDADEVLKSIEVQGIIITDAKNYLRDSEDAFLLGEYTKARDLAGLARDKALEIVMEEQSASSALDQARNAVDQAQAEERTKGLEELRDKLQAAQTSYNEGKYAQAEVEASDVYQEAFTLTKPLDFTPYIAVGAIVIIGVGIYVYFTRFREEKPQKTEEKTVRESFVVDTEAIFVEHNDLRVGDMEFIRFLAQNGGQAYMYEVRRRLDLPRSTAWRMMQRLVDLEIIEEQKVGNQSLVKILEGYLKE